MYDEDVGVEQLNELNEYLLTHPQDITALMFSAYCEDKKRWYEELQKINDEIINTQHKIVELYKERDQITKWQNFWRRTFRQDRKIGDFNEKIQSLNDYTNEVLNPKLDEILKRQPKDWEYKLAVLKSNSLKMEE